MDLIELDDVTALNRSCQTLVSTKSLSDHVLSCQQAFSLLRSGQCECAPLCSRSCPQRKDMSLLTVWFSSQVTSTQSIVEIWSMLCLIQYTTSPMCPLQRHLSLNIVAPVLLWSQRRTTRPLTIILKPDLDQTSLYCT